MRKLICKLFGHKYNGFASEERWISNYLQLKCLRCDKWRFYINYLVDEKMIDLPPEFKDAYEKNKWEMYEN